MEPTIGFWKFVWMCLGEAWDATIGFLNWDIKTVVTGIILLGIGYFLFSLRRGKKTAQKRAREDFLLTFAPLGLFAIGLFGFNCLRSPYLIYHADHENARQLVGQADNRAGEAERKEHEAEQKLETQAPRLEGVMEQAVFGEKSDTHRGMAVLQVEVKNTGGSPSIAEEYASEIRCGESIHKARLDKVPDAAHLHKILASLRIPEGLLEIGPLYDHSGAIPSGDHIRGWLFLEILDVKTANDLAIPGCMWVVSFADIHGHRYEVK